MGYFTKRQNIKFYNTSGGIIQQTCYIILRVCVRCFLVLFHFFKNNIILRQIHCIIQIILILYWRCYKLCRINSRQFENVKFGYWLISIHSKTWLHYMRRVCLKDMTAYVSNACPWQCLKWLILMYILCCEVSISYDWYRFFRSIIWFLRSVYREFIFFFRI